MPGRPIRRFGIAVLILKEQGNDSKRNVMEWYDFALYGYFVTVIGHQFFPSANPTATLIGAFEAFAAGFSIRPLGELCRAAPTIWWDVTAP